MKMLSVEDEYKYQRLIDKQVAISCRYLFYLAFSLFPIFSILDYHNHAYVFTKLTILRYGTVLLLFFLYLYYRKPKHNFNAYTFSILILSVANISISFMCSFTGGFSSPYYGGINLVLLAAVLVVPINARKMGGLMAILIGAYILINFFFAGPIVDTSGLLNNLAFMLATAIIGTAASHFVDNLRRDSFHFQMNLSRANEELTSTRDVLRNELQSEQGNVDTLAREITLRKIELEKALDLAREAEAKAQHALSLREEFISLASHELNTPLTALKLQTQLSLKKIQKDQSMSEAIVTKLMNTYDSQLHRLIRIVNDMLDISRLKRGKLELELAKTDLCEVVRNVAHTMSEVTPTEINISADCSMPIQCDQYRIEQVILNLISNAIKYGDKKPIDIGVGATDSYAFIKIKDHGIGINKESQNHIFNIFERAVKATDFSGLGLGLYISRQIVESHNGQILVESQEGKGSCFEVRLPL